MPDGLTDALTRGELVDLVRFLSELGKVGPYSVEQGAAGAALAGAGADAGGAATVAERPSVAAAAGDVPGAGVGAGVQHGGRRRCRWTTLPRCAVARTRRDVRWCAVSSRPRTGTVQLRLEPAKGVSLWLDGKPVDARRQTELDLTAGVHTLTFAVDLDHARSRCAWSWTISRGRRRGCAWSAGSEAGTRPGIVGQFQT